MGSAYCNACGLGLVRNVCENVKSILKSVKKVHVFKSKI